MEVKFTCKVCRQEATEIWHFTDELNESSRQNLMTCSHCYYGKPDSNSELENVDATLRQVNYSEKPDS